MHLFSSSKQGSTGRSNASPWRAVVLLAGVIGLTAAMTASSEQARAADAQASRVGPRPGHLRTGSPRQPTAADDSFGVYYAVRMGSSFVVAGVNGSDVPCGNASPATACYVSSIDLSPIGISAASARTILNEVGTNPRSVKLLFVGTVQNDALHVWQGWRAPEAVSTSAQLYSVSHANEQTLSVNDWTATSLGTLDFTYAPAAATCDIVAGTDCTPTLDAPTVQVHTNPGILLSGSTHKGVFRVESYFLDMSFGVTQSGDGYSYCKDGQFLCYNFVCGAHVNDCNTTHGRIRGLLDPPTLPTDPSFVRWQLSTGQLAAEEVYGP